MATTAAGFDWARPNRLSPSPETFSSNVPDRPIRPLPKRRIRSRLSEEQAQAIVYPPIPPSSSPLYGSPQSQSERSFNNPPVPGDITQFPDDRESVCDCGGDHSEPDSDEEVLENASTTAQHRYSWPGRMIRYPKQYLNQLTGRSKPPPPNSSTSSADGYESFENTNNKKKRKIPNTAVPTAGSPGEVSSGTEKPSQSERAVNAVYDEKTQAGLYYGSGSAAQSASSGVGVSGAGRGRYGTKGANRPVAERKPLGTSTNGANTFANASSDQQGIISTAIANANAGKASFPPARGQENISLLERQKQQGSNATMPKDFTFECESDSSKKLNTERNLRPQARTSFPHPSHQPQPPNVTSQGTQLTSIPASQSNLSNSQQPPLPQHAASAPQGQSHGSNAAPTSTATQQQQTQEQQTHPRRRARRTGDALLEAARRRREQKAWENAQNPPNPEDMWICEFCLYKSIFGKEPEQMIKKYELKERGERKREQDRRRLLEKAKAKGRKGKKGNKGGKNAGHGANTASAVGDPQQQQQQHHDPYGGDPGAYDALNDGVDPGLDSQGDEFYDDGYDEAPSGSNALPPHLDPNTATGNYAQPPGAYPAPPPPQQQAKPALGETNRRA